MPNYGHGQMKYNQHFKWQIHIYLGLWIILEKHVKWSLVIKNPRKVRLIKYDAVGIASPKNC